MAAIPSASPARDGDFEVRAAAALTTAYVGGKKVPSRTADSIEWSIHITTIGSITTLQAIVEYSNLSDPDDDDKEAGDAAANVNPEWIRLKDEAVANGVVTQYDKVWTWAGIATVDYTFGFTTPARGNWMRLLIKANDGTGSVVSARCMIKK